jgi:hypothetical protein
MGKAVDENLESGFLLKAKHYLTKTLLIFQGNFTRPSQITSHFEIPPPKSLKTLNLTLPTFNFFQFHSLRPFLSLTSDGTVPT